MLPASSLIRAQVHVTEKLPFVAALSYHGMQATDSSVRGTTV
jgi:hypothetical protein